MGFLSEQLLDRFQNSWTNSEGGDSLSCSEFIQLMINSFSKGKEDENFIKTDEDKYELAYGALKLFAEIDINGDGGMEWEEFIGYIRYAVSDSNIKKQDNNDKLTYKEI